MGWKKMKDHEFIPENNGPEGYFRASNVICRRLLLSKSSCGAVSCRNDKLGIIVPQSGLLYFISGFPNFLLIRYPHVKRINGPPTLIHWMLLPSIHTLLSSLA